MAAFPSVSFYGDTLYPVPFHGDTLYLVEHEGEPFTPAKPICEAVGLDWASQYTKLTGDPQRWGCWSIAIPSSGGEQKMLCLPVRKLSGWLSSISAARAKDEIRHKLISYQNECDDALWRYWSEGHATRPSAPAQASLDLAGTTDRRRADNLPLLLPNGWQGNRIAAARMQLEAASGILAGIEFARDEQTRRDLLTAAHGQCQLAGLFIANQFSEESPHA